MKISEMNNDQACDVLIQISQPIANIMDDDNLKEALEEFVAEKKEGEDVPLMKQIAKILPKIIPLAMKEHRADIYSIVGALTFKSPTEVAKMRFVDTLNEIKNSIDQELLDFFKLSGAQVTQPGK